MAWTSQDIGLLENKNYFEHFDLEPSFELDLGILKKNFLMLSKAYHPDFHTDKSEAEKMQILQLSSFNNTAFKTLKNPDSRFKYILLMHGVDFEESKQSLPQTFLMEMMDFNEKLMDVQMEGNKNGLSALLNELKEIEESLFTGVSNIIKEYKKEKISNKDLEQLKEYFFKRKYLLRIRENLNKFGLA